MRTTNLILVLIYLLSGTVLSGYGRISIRTENTISGKTNSPRQHYLSNQRLQKHIAPNFQNENQSDAALKPVRHDVPLCASSEFVGLSQQQFYSFSFFSELNNKAPPAYSFFF